MAAPTGDGSEGKPYVPPPGEPTWSFPPAVPPPGPPAVPPRGPPGPDTARRPGRRRRRWPLSLAVAVAAVACLIGAFGAGSGAHAELTRKPTAAELSTAAGLGIASRWQRWPAGQIFPAHLAYTSDLLTQETAQRAGIAPGDGCAAALDTPVAATGRRYGCRAALRASYVDQLGGIVYTIGVLAFPSPRAALRFSLHYAPGRSPVRGLHAAAFTGTPAAAFTDAARQAASARQDGPYVILTVAAYADGRPAAATGESRPAVFGPGSQLAAEVGMPLTQPVTVRCATPEWSC